ncbi:MAG: hypothetical protein NXI31_13935 [bacterium]|nr:hypothetical protein [bacterium]
MYRLHHPLLRFLLTSCLLVAATVAQAVPALELERIYRPWPAVIPGPVTDMVAGSFVAGHPGRCLVIVRDGELKLSFQPADFVHLNESGIREVDAIATVPGTGASADRLVVATTMGLRVLRYGDLGFGDANPAYSTYAEWIGAVDVEALALDTAPNRCVLAHAPGWVRCGMLDATDAMLPSLLFPAPPGQQVLDAALVDWQPGGWPEIAVLMTHGTFVFDMTGAVLMWSLRPSTAGRVLAMRRRSEPTLVQITDEGSDWRVLSFANTGQPGVQSFDGGTLVLGSAPIGLAEFDLEGDDYSDVLLSTGESVRRLLPGTPQGITTQGTGRLDLLDVRPDELPPAPLPNLASLVVDDLDRDGTEDLAVASRPTDQVILSLQARSQIQFIAFDTEDDGGEVERIEFVNVLGAETEPNFASTPVGFQNPLTGVDMVGLRLNLPDQIAGQQIDVVIYEVQPDGAPTSSDGVDPVATRHFRFTLNDADPGDVFDILVPIPDALVQFPTVPMPRYVLEISMVELVTGKPPKGTGPLLLEYAVQQSMGWMDFKSLLSEHIGDVFWFESIGFTKATWEAILEPEPVDPGSRYFGAIVVVKSHKMQSNPPKMPPPLTMDNGVAH